MQDPQSQGVNISSDITENDQEQPKEKETILSFLGELPLLIITAVIVAWLIKTLLVQPFFIPSSSMEPTLFPGDRVLVSKFTYRFSKPLPKDIVVFKAPDTQPGEAQDFIKRIVATPGMSIEVDKGIVIVDGKTRKEPFIVLDSPNSNFGPVTVPKNKVFVMGDNRANSKDSRFFGPVSKESLEGKGFLIYWPPSRMGLLK